MRILGWILVISPGATIVCFAARMGSGRGFPGLGEGLVILGLIAMAIWLGLVWLVARIFLSRQVPRAMSLAFVGAVVTFCGPFALAWMCSRFLGDW